MHVVLFNLPKSMYCGMKKPTYLLGKKSIPLAECAISI